MKKPRAIQIKRVYEKPSPDDGQRFLVDRVWPRGIRKEALADAEWLPEVAPSTELRKWFAHDDARWTEFQTRYRSELKTNRAALAPLLAASKKGSVTLLYSARDTEKNQAVVLKEFLEKEK